MWPLIYNHEEAFIERESEGLRARKGTLPDEREREKNINTKRL